MANVSKIRTTDGTLYNITGSGQSSDTTYTFSGSASATGYTITITPSTGTVQTVTIPLAVAADAGLLSPSDFAKLAGIEPGAEVNVQSDWDVTNTSSDAFIKNKPTIPSASSTTPAMDGTGAAGSSSDYARADHVHPTDTSRQATLVSGTNIKTVNNNSLLGSGNLTIPSGSTVSASADLSSGTKIGTVTVDGTATDFYSPTPPSATSTTPAMDGTASVGSETTYARGDHVHPTDTSRQETLVSGTNIKTINNQSVLGSGNISVSGGSQNTWYGTSSTSASTQTKTVTTSSGDFSLSTGNIVVVKFTNAQTYSGSYKLNVDGTGAVSVMSRGTTGTVQYSYLAGETIAHVYDGTNFIAINEGIASTTYYGVTKLSNSTSSTSTTLAATPYAVKQAYDYAVNAYNLADDAATVAYAALPAASVADYVTEQNISGDWRYRKWHSGKIEAWFEGTFSCAASTTARGALYYSAWSLTIPSAIGFTSAPNTLIGNTGDSTTVIAVNGSATSATAMSGKVWRYASSSTALTISARIYAWQN